MSNRRHFLGASALCSLAPVVPTFLHRLAVSAETQPQSGRRLVVIQLDGGNDGVNTIVPLHDEGYRQHRRTLQLAEAELLNVSENFAFHPRLRSLSQLFEQGRLSIVHGVGYPNPNRSHFESMKIWHAGSTDREQISSGSGWIGDAFGAEPHVPGRTHAIQVGPESLPQALVGRRCNAASIVDPDDLQLRAEISTQPTASEDEQGPTLIDFVSRSVHEAYGNAEQLRKMARQDASARYPENRLGKKLQLVSQLMKTDTGAKVYYTSQGGYDTHAGQIPVHENLLGELSSAIKAFMDDMQQSGLQEEVLVMCFSEFGRRVEENNSGGTDHGTAGPVFLAGTSLAQPAYGQPPSLTDLNDGDLKFNTDFRSLYAAIIDDWLGMQMPPSLQDYRLPGLFNA